MTGHWARPALALLLAGLAVPVLLWASAADPRAGGALPDLDPDAPSGVALQRLPGARRVLLGWATTIHNRGPGALRLNAGADLASGERAVAQTTADGQAVLAARVGRLRYVTGYGHRHWHLLGVARYTLTNARTGRVLTDHKQGFCVHAAPFATRECAREQPHAARVVLGLAPGHSDTYEAQLEGQHIAITRASAPTGTYILTQTVDPQHRLREASTGNDSASLRLRLSWHRGAPLPAVCALRTCPDTPTCPPSRP